VKSAALGHTPKTRTVARQELVAQLKDPNTGPDTARDFVVQARGLLNQNETDLHKTGMVLDLFGDVFIAIAENGHRPASELPEAPK
jgi:hypothetical protein